MKFIDLFSGIGGFRLGMEMAGHECVGHCEIDKFADKSYRAMHDVKEGEWYAADIRTVEPGDLPEADCYCGGFPCQAFSVAGKRRGFEDMRGTLIFEIFRLAKARKPKILFLENVAGLLNHDKGRTFGTILAAMDELGYDAEWQLLNSKNFGVPQNRERVFIIGHFRGKCARKVFPITRRMKEPGEEMFTLTAQDKHGVMIADKINVIGNVYGTQGQAGKLYTTDGLSPTVQGQRVNSQGFMYDNARIRRLTPKECFRLQGFPDEYYEKAREVNSDSQLYKQAGNSVTVNVIYEIAKRLV